jgi:hypothetical protein
MVDRQAHLRVLQRGVPGADLLAVDGLRAAVEGEVVEAVVVRGPCGDAVGALESREDVGVEVVGEVHLAVLQCLHQGVGVAVQTELDAFDGGGALPVVVVALERVVLPLPRLGQDERTAADTAGRIGVGLVGVLAELLVVDLGPDVLGEDGDREPLHQRGRLLQRHDDGGVVGSLDGV